MTANLALTATCACGSVAFEATGAPIACVACYCDDCQEAARRIEALPDAPSVRGSDGGTEYVVFRKDRVRCTRGQSLLQSLKLNEKSATKRLVAGCCNSAMLLAFDDAKHWADIYRSRVRGAAAPLEMRVCTKFAPGAVPRDVPAYPVYAPRFLAKLLAAKVAMMFGR